MGWVLILTRDLLCQCVSLNHSWHKNLNAQWGMSPCIHKANLCQSEMTVWTKNIFLYICILFVCLHTHTSSISIYLHTLVFLSYFQWQTQWHTNETTVFKTNKEMQGRKLLDIKNHFICDLLWIWCMKIY